jgi:hypothetical protein
MRAVPAPAMPDGESHLPRSGPRLTLQHSSLLFSDASVLLPALPFALITTDRNYVAAHTLQSATVPAHVEIGRYYYKKDVEDISQELDHVLSRGSAAAGEWAKGLDARGKERTRAAENWERWSGRSQAEPQRAPSAAPSLTATSHTEPSTSPVHRRPSPVIHAPVPSGKYASPVSIATNRCSVSPCHNIVRAVHVLTAVAPNSQYAQSRPPTVPPQVFTPQYGQTGSTQPSHQRNIHDANEAKASRKVDIEQRCQQMTPPIPPNILRHMDSFKAAVQISQPMTDYAWDVLQPRLLAQLPAAQQTEAEHVSRMASLSTKPADRRYHDVNSKEAKEAMDRDWEESQRPIRDKLDVLADDFINHNWNQGRAITYENSPKFAADLLAHVRRRFYEAAATEGPARTQHSNAVTNTTDSRPRLVLENMKWVYDTKIKPLTEQFRKDLYLCHGSPCDNPFKYFGFEGVVQHFGAKHTESYSSGNVVVAWREAEWPETTPFHPDPISVKHTYNGSNTTSHYHNAFPRAGTSTPHMQSHLPQASPGPQNFGGQYHGPFAPPQTPGPAMAGYEYSQQYGLPMDSYAYQAMGPPGYGMPLGSNSYMPSPALGNPTLPPPPMLPPGQASSDIAPEGAEEASHSNILFDKQVSTIIEMAQDIWKHTSGVKDMPNSLRIYVLLHRVVARFYVEFNHEPNLDHFVNAFANHEVPKAMKNAPGLSCKACQDSSSQQYGGALYAKPAERKTYTVLSLLSHYKSQHPVLQPYAMSYGQQAPMMDWKENMIELPSKQFISGMIHASGMDDEKLLMIATVFPSLFPMPLPKIGVIDDNGLVSRPLSVPKDVPANARDTPDKSLKPSDEEDDRSHPAQSTEVSSSTDKPHSHRDSPPGERRQRYYGESRFYVGNLQSATTYTVGADNSLRQMSRHHVEDGYTRPREHVEYASSPRVVHSGPAHGEYSGRRTGFREHDRIYGPPPDEVVYAHPRQGSHDRDYGPYPHQTRYHEEEDQRAELRYLREPPLREDSSPRDQSAADHFLETFVPGQHAATEPGKNRAVPPLETKTSAPIPGVGEGANHTPPPPGAPTADASGDPHRKLAAPHPRAPSTVSNGSRYEDHRPIGRHNPTDAGGPPRRAGPQRRRDRPHDQRMPSRYYRYMGVARDDHYGRGSSISRSQSKRYEEQRRRIDQQETPQPTTDRDYEPAYSGDHSVDHPAPEETFYSHPAPREYVSVQDRLHPYSSPPRYRYDEPHGPPPVYVDEYGHPVHEYEVVRVRGDPRHSRGPYMSYPPPARYEPDRYEYVPVPYERPAPQRYNSRGEYVYFEERERALPRRPAPEAEADTYEAPPPEIKLESAPTPMPEGP